MVDPHDTALFAITAVCALGSLLMADAAEEALRDVPSMKRRRAALLMASSHVGVWAKPMILRCASLGFLGGMVASGAILVGAFP